LIISTGVAQPKISVEGGTKFDLGTIDRGKLGEKKLTISNTGTDTLLLGPVEVSCGCTGTVVSSNHIPPGDTAGLLITFNSTGYVGEVHKSVTVNSNDIGSPKTLIEFTAHVVEDVVIDPRQLFFRNAEVGRVDTFGISVTNIGKEPFFVTGYTCTLGALSLNIPKKPIKPGQTIRVTGNLEPTEVNGALIEHLSLQTSNKRQPELGINIFGAIKEPTPK